MPNFSFQLPHRNATMRCQRGPKGIIVIFFMICILGLGGDDNSEFNNTNNHIGSITERKLESRLLEAKLNREAPESLRRMRRLEAIKADVLKKLRLHSPPEIKNISLPDLPTLQADIKKVEEISRIRETGLDDFTAGYKLYRLAEPVPDKRNVVFFDVAANDILKPSNVLKATFYLYIKRVDYEQRFRRTVLFIHDGSSRKLLSRHEITFGETGTWVGVDITSKVIEWQETSSSNHGLEVTCSDNMGVSLVVLHSHLNEDKFIVPVLEIEVSNDKERRRKRSLDEDCEVFPTGEKCCRQPLTVNFTDFGWNYIIAPKAIAAFTCKGECPSFHLGNMHAHVTNTKSCCVPKIYSASYIIYYDKNENIIIGKIPGMVVQKCFCI